MIIRKYLQSKKVSKMRIESVESILTVQFGYFLSKLVVSLLSNKELEEFEAYIDSESSREAKEELIEKVLNKKTEMTLDDIYEAYEEIWVKSLIETDSEIQELLKNNTNDEELIKELTKLANQNNVKT